MDRVSREGTMAKELQIFLLFRTSKILQVLRRQKGTIIYGKRDGRRVEEAYLPRTGGTIVVSS